MNPDWGSCAGLPPGTLGHCTFECDLFEQDCLRGEKCVPWSNDGGPHNATRCVEVVESPAAVGEACTLEGDPPVGEDDCDHGAMCFHVDDETSVGTCVAMCTGSPEDPQCPRGSSCVIGGDSILTLCLVDCHPLLDDCPEADVCIPSNDGRFQCAPEVSSLGYGEPCMWVNECGDGLACLADAVETCEGESCCTAFCDLDADDPDAACPDALGGQSCVPWYEGKAPAGLGNVGVCFVG